MCIRSFISSDPKVHRWTFYGKYNRWHFKLPWIWESMSSHYSGQRLKPFIIYIQVAWRKTLFNFVKSIGIRVSLFLVCFSQQSSLLKPVHLFVFLIIWSYVFVSTIIGSFYCLRLPNIFILFENTGCLRKMMQNIVKCYIR